MPDDTSRLRTLMVAAADQAFVLQMGHLYQVYLSNPNGGLKQRPATAKGIERSIEAYRVLMSAIESWNG